MKKIISLFLALLTVCGALAAFPVFAGADGISEPEDLQVRLGAVTVEPGTPVARLGLYISAKALPEQCRRLRDWQFAFDGAKIADDGGNSYFPAVQGLVYGTTIPKKNEVGATTEAGVYFAAADDLTSGEVKVAEIGFIVPPTAAAGAVIDVEIVDVVALSFEDENLTPYYAKYDYMDLLPGRIVIAGDASDGTTADIYANGMENWGSSPNIGDMEAVTQILFCPYPWNGEHYVPGLPVTVRMKAVDGTSDDTFTTTLSTVYDGSVHGRNWGICRVEPCLMDTPWIPEKDKRYTATFTFETPSGNLVTVTVDDEYFLDREPIVPGEDSPFNIAVHIYDNGMENWDNSPNRGDEAYVTQILFCPEPWDGDHYVPGLPVTVNMKAVDGTSDDTFQTTVQTVYNGRNWGICRIEPCLMDPPWIPVKDKHYIATFTFETPSGRNATVTVDDEYFLDREPVVPGGGITHETKIHPYANGMENWDSSPNKGDMEAVTQILFCPSDWNASYYKPGLEVTVNMKALDGSSDDTFTTALTTVYNGKTWGICRVEPCLMDRPWIPVKDQHYIATFTFENASLHTVTVVSDGEYYLDREPVVPVAPPVLYGDVNGDGFVNKKDSLALKKYLADNSYPIDRTAADVYYDGVVNKKDSLRLKQWLAGWDVSLGDTGQASGSL